MSTMTSTKVIIMETLTQYGLLLNSSNPALLGIVADDLMCQLHLPDRIPVETRVTR